MMRPVAVLGATGGVGRAAVRHLAAAGVGPLRLGCRRPEPAAGLLDELRACGEAVAADATCPDSLARFCAGSRLVVNCAGPSHALLGTVALAAVESGADLVDAGGDEAVHPRLSALDTGERRLVLAAGLMPGLSGVLPRILAAGFERPRRLTAYAGGRGHLTPAAAADYLAGLGGGGRPLAAWERGGRRSRALTPLRGIELPPFPGRVTAHPFLSAELERVARDLGLEEARWYNVFDGVHLPEALARLQGTLDAAAVEEVVRAASLDLFGRQPYQLVVLQLEGGEAEPCRTLLLSAGDGIELTGAVTALVARAVLAGEVGPGLHHADSVLEPRAWCERLRALPEVRALEVAEGPAAVAVFEEGAL